MNENELKERAVHSLLQSKLGKVAPAEAIISAESTEAPTVRSGRFTDLMNSGLFALNMNDLTSALRVNWKQCLSPVLLETAI